MSTYEPELLPTLREMRETWTGPEIGLWTFANYKGSLELAYAFSSVFWPDLIEAEDGVFLAARFSTDSLHSWLATADGDMTRVEATMNHVHIGDLWMNSPADEGLPPEVAERVGEVLAACWEAAAKARFPGRRVRTEVSAYQGDVEVTLFTDRT